MNISTPDRDLVSAPHNSDSNVTHIFSRKASKTLSEFKFIRLSPEYDGLCILYSNKNCNKNKLYTMKIICWGIRANDEIVGIVAWMNKAIPCTDLTDTEHGSFEGYYDPVTQDIFFSPPAHKTVELEIASRYTTSNSSSNNASNNTGNIIIQEIPDSIGTHAMLYSNKENLMILTEVLSWQLHSNGELEAMLIDDKLVDTTPVLPGDPCLYQASSNPEFRYFFQHHIANLIKTNDPDTVSAISILFD